MYHQFTAAVAGTGFIGPVHIEALQRLGVRVRGVLGSNPEKSEKTRQALGLDVAYDNFNAVLRDDQIDAIHLAVPNVLHFEYAKSALLAGKHVMCEKPLAMNGQETSELLSIAQASGLHAGVCYNIRFYPLNLEAKNQISQGHLGRIFSIKGSYVQDWLMYETDYNWRVLVSQGGPLRAVADIGTHWIDLITSITGLEVEAVMADLQTVHPVRKRPKGEIATFSGKTETPSELEDIPIETDDGGSILFRFKNGAKGQLWVSQITAGRKNCVEYELAGSAQSLSWNSERPNELWIGKRNEPNQIMIKDAGLTGEMPAHFINYPGGHNEGFPDTFKQCFRAFYDAIDHDLDMNDVLYPSFEQGHKEVLICEAILKSHQEERWVTL